MGVGGERVGVCVVRVGGEGEGGWVGGWVVVGERRGGEVVVVVVGRGRGRGEERGEGEEGVGRVVRTVCYLCR